MLIVTESGTVYSQGNYLTDVACLGTGDNHHESSLKRIEFFETRVGSMYGPVVRVGAGQDFSVFVTKSGQVFCCGINDAGQLGTGDKKTKYPRLIEYFMKENIRIVDIACGDKHVIALADNGVVFYWGNNDCLEPKPMTLPSKYENGIKGITKIVAGGFSFILTNKHGIYYQSKKTDFVKFDINLFNNAQTIVDVAVNQDKLVILTTTSTK